MLLAEIVSTSAGVAATSGRKAKIEQIADLLARVPVDEVPVAVAFLSGDLTQRQIGVGYAALMGLGEAWSPWLAASGPVTQAGAPESPRSDRSPDPSVHVGSIPGSIGSPPDASADGAALAEVVAEEEAHTAPASQASLTLTETDASFDEIGALAGPGSQARRRELLASLVERATESERQFLVRLIAGDLRQGALEGVMTDAVAKAAGAPAAEVRRAHQLRGSLAEVARAALSAAADGNTENVVAALRAFTLRVGQPVRPMLAASAPSLEAAFEKISPAALEWKIDGIRIQIHREGDRARVFSRTLDDITHRVPEIVSMALDLPVSSAVIDGEAVALRQDGRPYPFQVTAARAASQSSPNTGRTRGASSAAKQAAVPLTAFLFDLLHIDGEDLIDLPEGERFQRLAAIAPADALIPRVVTADMAEAADFFADALARGHEGVVVKSAQSSYGAGRRGGDWIKVKPRTTLDLVILGAEWGHGRRTGWLSNLHLGARDPETGGFVMLGKTFKGLTDAMLTWQTERLLALAEQPQARSEARPFGVVKVRPELVAEIAFDGVQASRRYPGGVALRFARVLRYREDKKAAEADTIDMVRALWPHTEEDG